MEQEGVKKGLFSRVADVFAKESDTLADPLEIEETESTAKAEFSAEDEVLLREILTDVQSHGPQLKQFIELASALTEIIPQESACFQATLKALEQTAATTKPDLLVAADRQLAALDQERQSFEKSIREKSKNIEAIGKKGEAVRARIDELQATIQALSKEEQELYSEKAKEEDLVRSAQARFETITRKVEQDIQSLVEKIDDYLADDAGPEKKSA
ncbi:MAG: hypothetical protein WDA20_11890 [Desulfuromonadales bacterium]